MPSISKTQPSRLTCLKFEKVDKRSAHDLEFIYHGDGCTSHLGNDRKTKSEDTKIKSHHVNVPWRYCGSVGTVIHEVMHALGFEHEMNRFDRKEYAWIYYENVNKTMWSNFQRSTSQYFGTPYDYGSIMHYGPTYFTLDKKKFSIVALKHEYQNTMGQRDEPSFKDIKLINRLYCK
uniref:Metalloendopeptidase n=1 Tax=Meloidogyne floridensis TaxID=298350 RepID=A0A915NG76_9BILA